ncbi:MAG: hypothetical protein K2L91_04310 [Duncaniella sp.]|nr:hypothetical protein [Duncaniella sp.]MDE6170464.1 hypothetical protein [Duncaniella sp.]MDE6327731.1 hypothetical protein [Duncaniella sp.]
MTYSLSTSVIIDTIQATAAFRVLSAPEEIKSLFAPLLRPEVRGQLKIMVKNAFAETILLLLPHVSDCCLDDESAVTDPGPQDTGDTTELLLKVTLGSGVNGRDYAGAAVRRHLEQAVAMRALAEWSLAGGDSVTHRAYLTLAEASVDRLKESLVPVSRPFLRSATD